jgi:hypothetical protein
MPALDECEPHVIKALEKDGWVITDHPFMLRIKDEENKIIYADFRAERDIPDELMEIIIVEVKCFPEKASQREELYRALGQFLFYYEALKPEQLEWALHLAVPQRVYDKMLKDGMVSLIIQDIHIKLIVIDIETEEVKSWIS